MCEILNESVRAKEEVDGWNCRIQYDLGGPADVWFKIEDSKFSTGKGKINNPDVVMTLTEENAAKMFAGELDSTSAYMSGDLKIDGALAGAQKFGTLMQIFQEEFENSKS